MRALSALSARERTLLLAGALIVAALGLWQFAWVPVIDERKAVRAETARYLSLTRIAERADALRAAQPTPSAAVDAPLAQRVTRSAEAAGVDLARLEPQGRLLTLVVQEADFETIIAWIVELEQSRAARATSVELSRLTAPGTITARITVEDMS